MSKPIQTKTDLFAAMEDDVRQFRDALFKALCAAPSAIAKRVGQITQTIRPTRDFPQVEVSISRLYVIQRIRVGLCG
jgi:hypothetical protein